MKGLRNPVVLATGRLVVKFNTSVESVRVLIDPYCLVLLANFLVFS